MGHDLNLRLWRRRIGALAKEGHWLPESQPVEPDYYSKDKQIRAGHLSLCLYYLRFVFCENCVDSSGSLLCVLLCRAVKKAKVGELVQ